MPITDKLAAGHGRWRRWGFAAVSLLVHAGLLGALVLGTGEQEAAAAEPEPDEEVTFVDISRVAPPPPPLAAAEQPEPQQPDPPTAEPDPTPRQPRPQPRTPPRAADIIEPVDSLPEEPLGGDVPPAPAPRVESSAPARASASGSVGGGQAGGVAGGVEGGVEGGRQGGVVGGQGDEVPEESGTFIAAVVDRQAELSNRRSLPRLMQRLYPDALQDAGIGGRVVVQFVVGTNGRVDMSTLKILSSSHDGFVEPTRKAIGEFRFRPARMGDRNVRMLTQLPIEWEVER